MGCLTKYEVCCCLGSEIGILATVVGSHTLKFKTGGKLLSFAQVGVVGESFTLPFDANENAIMTLEIVKPDGSLLSVNSSTTFFINSLICNDVDGDEPIVDYAILEYTENDVSGLTFAMQGLDIDGTVLNFPYAYSKYYFEIFLNGSRLSSADYTINSTTGLITFEAAMDEDRLLIKLTKK